MTTEVQVPDIGAFDDVPIIEVHVKAGDRVNEEDPLITLESDKATMDVPAPMAGQVVEIPVKIGDRVSTGSLILTIDPGDGAAETPPTLVEQQEPETPTESGEPSEAHVSVVTDGVVEVAGIAEGGTAGATGGSGATGSSGAAGGTGGVQTAGGVEAAGGVQGTEGVQAMAAAGPAADFTGLHAGPSVRRTARELGVELTAVTGSGPKGRITKDDLLAYLRGPSPEGPVSPPVRETAAGTGIPEIPAQDFAQFGPVETRPLSRIRKLSGTYLHRSWLNVPHVTHHDEADITLLDAYRRELDAAAQPDGYRVTLLAFLLKASVSGLKRFPEFNSSLSPEKDSLIVKGYYHLGVAVDTPGGLVVPVIRDVDRKGITELSQELGAVSARARDGKLAVADLQGGTFTISSLGGIGGVAFTPIVNAPEVAILGVVRSAIKPVWNGEEFTPRLMLPLSLSYDHRVIDGALAARFVKHLCHVLEDPRRLIL